MLQKSKNSVFALSINEMKIDEGAKNANEYVEETGLLILLAILIALWKLR